MNAEAHLIASSERSTTNLYKAFGLTVRSELPLAELDELAAPSAEPDVVIRLGKVPRTEADDGSHFRVTERGALLDIPNVGRFLVTNGREIVADADPAGSERHLRLYLLGSAFGVILHQRGLLPLHSNAIELDGQAIGFMGASGAGKSTMAAWFHDRGYNVLADDVCVVTFGEERLPIAHPGIPRLRLWRDALESSGRKPEEHEHAFDDADKYNVRTRGDAEATPLPLGVIYLLGEPGLDIAKQGITRLLGIDAIEALVANTYRGSYAPLLGLTQQHLAQCVELARRVPIYKLERVWGFEAFEEQARLVEEHARANALQPLNR